MMIYRSYNGGSATSDFLNIVELINIMWNLQDSHFNIPITTTLSVIKPVNNNPLKKICFIYNNSVLQVTYGNDIITRSFRQGDEYAGHLKHNTIEKKMISI